MVGNRKRDVDRFDRLAEGFLRSLSFPRCGPTANLMAASLLHNFEGCVHSCGIKYPQRFRANLKTCPKRTHCKGLFLVLDFSPMKGFQMFTWVIGVTVYQISSRRPVLHFWLTSMYADGRVPFQIKPCKPSTDSNRLTVLAPLRERQNTSFERLETVYLEFKPCIGAWRYVRTK
ncbi:hypothetical protein BJ165DRAFT_1449094 [Panaeolus papilionaceus]|nr:hypothetical protein BJ165DRAFT_1449094 [Panaeolus papilionaceus]